MPNIFNIGDSCVERSTVRASMVDGAILRGYVYQRVDDGRKNRKKTHQLVTPLLCLASELGNARQHHRFALALNSREQSAQKTFTLDLRGRGRSDSDDVAASDVATDADDLISFCDAHNLHHIDLVVSGYSAFVIFHAVTKRPGLVRRLILNDAAPEFDAVGIARRTALMQRAQSPTTWQDCIEQLRALKGEEFPEFSDQDWQDVARQKWRDQDGKPVLEQAKGLVRWSNLVDYDSEQPSLWRQFNLFKRLPVMLIRGEHSTLVTQEIADKCLQQHPELDMIVAVGQGHVPQLERGHLPSQIIEFLLRK